MSKNLLSRIGEVHLWGTKISHCLFFFNLDRSVCPFSQMMW